jgi:serine/threonine-protein kinase
MDLARLKPLLPPAVAAQADVLWRRFAARHKDGDVNDFVASLHADGHLDADRLRAILSSLDVTLTLSEGVAAAPPERRHRLLGLLGKGAMGEVFIGRDPQLLRNVAIKRMDARLAANPVLASRFSHEVQITAQLDHPAIIPVYGLEPQPDGTLAYSMKLIRGRTLKQVIAEAREIVEKGGRLPPELSLPARLEIFLQVCSAMAHAHTRGVVHRDLKPDNIMVGAFQEVIVMDWGVARLMGGAEVVTEVAVPDGRAERTQHGLALGTPRYMSPEQALGRNDELDGRSDQFALGLILQELICLKPARSGKSAAQVLKRAAAGERDPLRPLDPGQKVPRELSAIVAKATAPARRARYPDVATLADDVRRYLRDEEVVAEPDTLPQRLARAVGRNRHLVVAIVAVLCLLVLLTAALGVVGALGVREVARGRAEAREARLAEILGVTAGQARRMESSLLRYEGLLQGLAGVAETRLAEPPLVASWFLAETFSLPGKAPPDLQPSRYYDGRVSLAHPDVVLAPGVVEDSVRDRIAQAVSLTPVFRDVHRTSSGEAPDWEIRLRNDGLPVVWSYVATEEGLLVGFPGTGVYPEGYDPRTQHWYVGTPREGSAPHWEPAYLDESGMGLLVTTSRALHAPDGRFLGVAAIDITVGYLIDTYLAPEGLRAPVEGWLVDGEGRVVVRSGLKQEARTLRDWSPPPFPEPEVLAAVRAGGDSGQHAAGGQLYAWATLPTLGWTYLVSGSEAALLEE